MRVFAKTNDKLINKKEIRRMKKLIAALLTLALAFTLALPAMAEESEAPNPGMPVITWQPQYTKIDVGRSFQLEVSATIDEGSALAYQWYRDGVLLEGETGRSFSAVADTVGVFELYVEVYNADHPEHYVTSDTVTVEVKDLPFTAKLWRKLIGIPVLGEIIAMTVAMLVPGFGWVLLGFGAVALFAAIISLPARLLEWVRGLFN